MPARISLGLLLTCLVVAPVARDGEPAQAIDRGGRIPTTLRDGRRVEAVAVTDG